MIQRDIVERARLFALELANGPTPIKKNVLLALVSDFLSSRPPDRERLRRILTLVKEGNGGHVLRGEGYGDQVRAAVDAIEGLLQEEELSDEQYKSLFGWTARLLVVKQSPAKDMDQEAAEGPGRRTFAAPQTGWRRGGRPTPPPPPPPPPPKITTTRWPDVEIGWHKGSPAVIRGKQPAVPCPRELLPSDLLDALKDKKTKIKADVLVVKIPGGGGYRVDKIESWKIVP